MTTVEKYAISIRQLSESLGNITALCSFINSSIDGLVKSPSAHLDNVLETLEPQQHALGILGILLAKFQQLESPEAQRKYVQVENTDLSKLLNQTDLFVNTFNVEQVRCSIDTFNELMLNMTELLVERKEANRGIKIAIASIERIRSKPTELTVVHSCLCHLCLSAKNFLPALPYLDADITDIQKASGLTSSDCINFLLYYYYGGMIYAALKQFKRALFFFEIVICTPASTVSAIMLEAYKKYVLVHLISRWAEPTIPKFASVVVTRHIKPYAAPYQELALAFQSSKQELLESVAEKNRNTYNQDSNYGLVKQCVTALYKRNIQRLTKTFITLSLVDVAQRVHLRSSEEAETYVRMMIEEGEIFATINKADGMVEFLDNPEKYNNPVMLDFLQKQEQVCMTLNTKLADMERWISTTPDYVNKVSSYQSEEDGGPKASTSYSS